MPDNPPILVPRKWARRSTALTASWLLAVAAIFLVLHTFPPDRHSFYPRCQLHRLTGLSCPGCGSLRALHELSHGRVAAAMRLNPLLIAALAAGAVFAGWSLCRKRSPFAWDNLRPIWIWTGFAVVLAFGALRNLPFPPFDRLGP